MHFEKGFPFTIKELLIRPGKCVREYISENRSRLVKPIIFLIVTSLIYTLAAQFIHIERSSFATSGDKTLTFNAISNWVHTHYGYANVIMGFFIACWLKIFFRKHDVNFFEISILLSFVMGIGMLLFAVGVVLNGVTGLNLMPAISFVTIVYLSWAIGQFFDQKKPTNFIKAGAAYALGFATFSAGTRALGFGYDAITKYVN